ncbi:type II secretion system protein N [Dyella sp. M7H15-1]|uniref:type II secretion system protein N n=1 Tax=Dyella sp. M7H15-1 TaxID=2501295 RepID=UPI0010050C54|nr:type II secretion system protein N [Dyella sp. M7H15-1]QAU25102.1 type II secretion system protein N [Dyella sp. M7H15-1]
MKYLRTVLTSLAVFVVALGLLIGFMPAYLALPLMQSRLHGLRFSDVGGTLWQGHAAQVSAPDGTALGSLTWTLSRRALLGDVQLRLALHQPKFQVRGQMHRISDTQEDWRDVALQLDMSMLGMQPLLQGEPQGQLDVHIMQARLQGGWPMQVDAFGTWSQAAVRTAQGVLPLGTLLLRINGQAGVLKAVLDDDGSGPLQTAGRLSFSPLGWDLQLSLKPRGDNPPLMHWLHDLGPVAADGSVQLRYRGGLSHLNANTENP